MKSPLQLLKAAVPYTAVASVSLASVASMVCGVALLLWSANASAGFGKPEHLGGVLALGVPGLFLQVALVLAMPPWLGRIRRIHTPRWVRIWLMVMPVFGIVTTLLAILQAARH
jgi:hypothetical protein